MGNESFYEPFIKYLLAKPKANLLTDWSREGMNLLKHVFEEDFYDDQDSIVYEWKEQCDGTDDPVKIGAAMLLSAHGDDDILSPVYEMYNHRNGHWFNTESYDKGDTHETKASRTIQAGEQI